MRIAVVGSGISGLSAAWLLDRAGHKVTLFEQNAYIGGHTNTVSAPLIGGGHQPVDTGFIVFNEATYPNLIALLKVLEVPTLATDMSFAVTLDHGRLEYSGSNLAGMFAQRRNLLNPGYYLMLRDIVRFYREAPSLLDTSDEEDLSLGDYLAAKAYGKRFIQQHLLPMAAAIWSCPTDQILAFPARSFVQFFRNHGLLELKSRPRWHTVAGGSRAYVDRILEHFGGTLHKASTVTAIQRFTDGVLVDSSDGRREVFDHVIIGAHADQALAMLTDASPEERRILGAFRYQPNRAVLHRDPALMPKRRRAWAAWNYLATSAQTAARVSVTYWMNKLQGIDRRHPFFVTLNPLSEPAPDLKIAEFLYDHPVFDHGAIAAQAEVGGIQGARRVWFCGAYLGYGFHEDGLSAGLAVAEAFGAKRPWVVRDASPAGRHATPQNIPVQAADTTS